VNRRSRNFFMRPSGTRRARCPAPSLRGTKCRSNPGITCSSLDCFVGLRPPRNDRLHRLRWSHNEETYGRKGMSARIIFGAFAVAAGIAVTHALAQAPTAPTPAAPWVTLAPFPDPSEEVLGAVAGGKLYVLCGLGPSWTPKALVYEYDPASN